jgi:hypothetical protein
VYGKVQGFEAHSRAHNDELRHARLLVAHLRRAERKLVT